MDQAELMFRGMVAWWDASDIEKKMVALEPLDYYPGGVCGRDREGDFVMWGRYGAIDPSSFMSSFHVKEVQLEAARRYALVHHMHREDAKRLNEPIEGISRGHYQMQAVLDVQGLGWRHTGTAGYGALKMVLKIPGFMFPETLKRAIIVRPPKIFYFIWSIVKLFIDPETVKKIVVVSGNHPLKEIEKFIHIRYTVFFFLLTPYYPGT